MYHRSFQLTITGRDSRNETYIGNNICESSSYATKSEVREFVTFIDKLAELCCSEPFGLVSENEQ